MEMSFCPNEIAFGNVATWLAAVATFLAVWAALVTSSRSLAELRKSREEDRERAIDESDALAMRLSVVFHNELWLMAEQLKELLDELESPELAENPAWIIEVMKHKLPTSGFSLLKRFADKLGVFERGTAAQLMVVLSFWNFIIEAPLASTLEDASDDTLKHAVKSTAGTIRHAINEIAKALVLVTPLASKVRSNLPSFDWAITE